MIFSELYGAYYNTVARILSIAVKEPLKKNELREIIEANAFGESVLNIEPAIAEEQWQLIHADGVTPLQHVPTMPLTILEKRWLKAIFEDTRIKLFSDQTLEMEDVEPLFRPEDVVIFDKYSDGDSYNDESYIQNFRLILDAICNHNPLNIDITNRRGGISHVVMMPDYLEYSEKDDKFRLIGSGYRHRKTVNLARIVRCEVYHGSLKIASGSQDMPKNRTVEFELFDKRNALDRVLLHFAHFEKQAEKLEEDRYRVTLSYDKRDETEVLIRILSFGPMVKVTAPQHFIDLIKERLVHQKSCEH